MSHLDFYDNNAELLSAQYNGLNPEKLHSNWVDYIPSPPGLALDIGGGSGRDAVWLADKGWDVTVVEPSVAFRELGRANSEPYSIKWIDDRLPHLKKCAKLGPIFSLILVSAVFMHLTAQERADSFETLAGLLAENGLLTITLRNDPWQDSREFHFVHVKEILQFATLKNFTVRVLEPSKDQLYRDGVTWQTVIVKNMVSK